MIKETVMTKATTAPVQFTKADKVKFSILVATILTVVLGVVYNITYYGIHCTF
jgi:hypothetical protein